MVDRKSTASWGGGAAGLLLFICLGTIVAVFLLLREGRRVQTSASDLALKRPVALTLKATVMPGVDGTRAHWLKIVPFLGGALGVGRTTMDGPPVLVALDSNGVSQVQSRLPSGACNAVELVSIGSKSAIVLCATARRLDFFGVDYDGTHLTAKMLPGGAVPWSSPTILRVFGSTRGQCHFWLSPHGGTSWAIGYAEGLRVPSFALLPGVLEVSDIAALSDTEAVLATVANGSRLELLVASPNGQVTRRASVRGATSGDAAMARPQLLADRSGILVVWLERQRQPLSAWLAPDKSVLLVQRFDFALSPLGEPARVSEDPFVASFSLQQTGAGGVITWDQGVRDFWDAASLIRFDSESASRAGSALRIPYGRRPLSLVATNLGLLALQSYGETSKIGYRTILLKPP